MLCQKLLTSLFVLGLLASCALQSASTGLSQYQQAVACYEAKDYYEAARLFEEALPQLRGKSEEASAHFYHAYCSFHQKKYVQSSDRFKYLLETFLRDPRVEEALYMQGHTLYLESPYGQLDQAFTQEATHVLRSYLHRYPEGTYADKARAQLEELNNKLARKAFNSAKLYYQLAHYRATVVTLANFQKDFPSAPYNEEAAYLKAEAQYKYFQEVQQAYDKARAHLKVVYYREDPPCMDKPPLLEQGEHEKEGPYIFHGHKPCPGNVRYEEEQQELERKDQLRTTLKYCQEFLDNYPDSPYARAVGAIYASLAATNEPVTPKTPHDYEN